MAPFKKGDLVIPKDEGQREVIERQILGFWKDIPTPYFPLEVVEDQGGGRGIVRFTNGYECFAFRVKPDISNKSLEDYM